MIKIETIDNLREALLSDHLTGAFHKPVKEFVKSKDIIRPENRDEYVLPLEDGQTLHFQLNQGFICFKGYYIQPEKHLVFHRLGNLPASLYYLGNGQLNTTSWFVNGHPQRDHSMQPVTVDRRSGNYWTFQYASTDDHFFEMSHIIYDTTGKGRVIDMLARQKGSNISHKEIKVRFPFVADVSYEDCYDLSKNIFTDDQVTLLRMIDI